MKKLIIIIFSFLCLFSCLADDKKEVPVELEKAVTQTAQRFAYQEHFSWEAKEEMCTKLIKSFQQLSKIKSEKAQSLILDIYLLGSDYETCKRENYDGSSRFKGWEEIEKYIKKTKNIKNKNFSCKSFRKDDWVAIFLLTNDTESCPEAMKLVEPHYSYAYKMRNWE